MIASIGLLVCLIFIKTVGESTDWILRIPPGIAILHNAYAIWNLSKRAAGRTPASSASYFIFACIFDAGLIPFMVYTTLGCRNEWLMVLAGADGHWTTLYGDSFNWPEYTLQATWVTATSLGCMLVVTFCMCVYLVVGFKRIAKLPPDMNPFEENLTSRSNSVHKKTKSTISVVTETESNRDSMTALLNEKSRQMPWLHTRNGSTSSFGTASPPRSPRHSRYESTDSLTPPRSPYRPQTDKNNPARNSTASLSSAHRRHGHARTDSNGEIVLPASPNRHSNSSSPDRSSANSPIRSSALNPGRHRNDSPAGRSIYHDARASRSTLNLENTAPVQDHPSWPLSPAVGISEGNWLSSGSAVENDPIDMTLVPKPLDATPPEFRHLRGSSQDPTAKASDRPYVLRTASKYDFLSRSPKPLGMNPPTPPVDPLLAAENVSGTANGTYRSNRASRANKVRQALSATNGAENRGTYGQVSQDIDGDDEGQHGVRGEEVRDAFLNKEGHDRTRPALQSKWSSQGRQAGQRVISSGFEERGMRQGAVSKRQVSGKMVDQGQGSMQALRAEMGWA